MQLLLTTLIVALLAIPYSAARAQSKPDTAHSHPSDTHLADPSSQPDDEFNIFLLAIGIAIVGIIIGATVIGSAAATLFLLLLFTLVSTGILSAGILIGLFRKSVSAAFTTILSLICSITITIAGAASFWIINRIFHIELTTSTALLIGAFSGLLGGLLLSFTLAAIIRIFFNYCRQKLSF